MDKDIFLLAKEIASRWQSPDERAVLGILGPDLLGIGGKRCALADGSLVVKIPWRERGLWENHAEAALWEWAPEELRDLLAPVVKIDRGLLWQERCIPIASGSRTRELQSRLARWGISDSAKNLGILGQNQRRIVCYDYAFFSPEIFRQIEDRIAKNEQRYTFDIE
jgi:hypothetical protein